jgi:hypothetical protein
VCVCVCVCTAEGLWRAEGEWLGVTVMIPLADPSARPRSKAQMYTGEPGNLGCLVGQRHGCFFITSYILGDTSKVFVII